MKFGVMFANTGFGSSPDGAVALAQAAEAGGFETLWTVEHVVVPSGYESTYPYDPSGKMAGGAEVFDLPDPLIWLTWVAAHTERIRLATGVLVLPQRNPVVTAKELATLDHLSGGRLTLGVGAGWLAEEFAALGVPFDERGRPPRRVHRRAARAVGAERRRGEVDGRRAVRDVRATASCGRGPANGTIPIVIGGHTPAAARRAGRRGDGFFPGQRLDRGAHRAVRHRARPRPRRPGATRRRSSCRPGRWAGPARSSTSASSSSPSSA